ncbi:MAG: phosphoglycerate dehydrogenase [Gammaproteobacteria bacterium]|nr:phosphoglycerate dehydrogenase [Gammaproteobacteria bacterium]
MFKVKTLNNIAAQGLERFPSDRYEVGAETGDPDIILVRSQKMHDLPVPASLKAIGRAGAGVNNIPVDAMSKRGIPVFNAPGANSNAVKELVVAGLFLACRNICEAWDYVRGLHGSDEELSKQVEAGKKMFAGIELPGRSIGVVGLGYIGRQVANLCLDLGMHVVGYDPQLTVDAAWKLSASVERADSLQELAQKVDFITFHVPLTDSTRGMFGAEAIASMRPGGTVMNFARDGIVDNPALLKALDAGTVGHYVSDFPTTELIANPKVIALPHLGASTEEAEVNCAIMVAEQTRDYLENGNLRNSVNFPEVQMRRGSEFRLVVANANVPNMLGQISTAMAAGGLNIHDMINQSRNDLAYTIVDTDSPIPDEVVEQVRAIQGVLMARRI